jgi:hypothetical protein
MSGDVIRVRKSAHSRAAGLGLTGGPRLCRDCGQSIRLAKKGSKWFPVDAESRERHHCRPGRSKGDRLAERQVRRGYQ